MIRLHKAGVDSPRRDCLVLVEDLLKKERSWVLAHHEEVLSDDQLTILESQILRREKREPLAYIRGKAWFYGRFFGVNPEVLVPRPESESFITLIKGINASRQINTVWDIGTGSGCLAITLKLELPNVHVSACDISTTALSTARQNVRNYKVNIRLIKSDLLSNMPLMPKSRAYTIMANLPYVEEGKISSPEINYEPASSLFSGKKGLCHYKKFFDQIEKLKNPPRNILTESLKSQHKSLEKFAKKAGYKLMKTEVLIQHFKNIKE